MSDDPLELILGYYQYDFERLERDIEERKRAHRRARANIPSDRPVVLSARGLVKTYKSGKNSVAAVRGVNFDIHEGEIVAVTGPSGSGKSTVLNLLSGLDHPDAGSIHIDSTDITKLSRNRMAEFRSEH